MASKKKSRRRNLKLPFIFIIILLFSFSVLIYSQNNNSKNLNKNLVNNNSNTYINEDYSFKITYPKSTGFFYSCDPNDQSAKQNPLKVFNDQDNNSIYISNENFTELKYYPNSNGEYEPDYKNCKIVDNNLNIIKNGFQNGRPAEEYNANLTKPISLQIAFSKIENEKELNDLVHKIYPTCYVKSKELNKFMDGVYNVYLADINGVSDNPDGDCFTNSAYFFYYSPRNKSAVITDSFQNGPFFPPDNENGVPVIEFIK